MSAPVPSEPHDIRLIDAHDTAFVPAIGMLFTEYGQSLGFSLCFQNFDQELATLPGRYAPPDGCLLMCVVDNTPAGCVAYRSLGADICEMKRLFVRPEYRGFKIGRLLTEELIHRARAKGYTAMRLDTISPQMDTAINLYRSLGFTDIPPYNAHPIAGSVWMEKKL